MHLHLKVHILLFIFLSPAITSCYNNEDIDPLAEGNPVNIHRSRATILEFPDIYEIMNSTKVHGTMDAAWKEMLKHCTYYARLEVGFYIYYDRDNHDYIIGEWIYGPLVTYAEESAYINMGKPVNDYTVCAFFHCHPPSYTIKGRPTGASTDDEALAYKLGIPGVVYDYYAEHVTLFFPYDEFKDEPCPYIFGPRKRDPHIY